MDPLKRKCTIRSAYRDHAKKLVTEFEKDTDKSSYMALSVVKQCIEDKKAEINGLDDEIIELIENDEGIKMELNETLLISDMITKTVVTINSYLKKLEWERSSTTSSSMRQPAGEIGAKLPKLEIPPFDGDILAFRGFWDQYQAAIHLRTDLKSIQKFGYLKTLLKGSAADLVSGISLSETNYTKAIDLLHDRFGNTQSLIAALMDQLVTIPKVHDINDVKKLRTVYDRLESNIRNLTDLHDRSRCDHVWYPAN